MEPQIAVFSKTRKEFIQTLKVSPSKYFILVIDHRDIRGRIFDAVIFINDWWLNGRAVAAYDILKREQPFLFKDYETART